ncbi:MAG: hypothetical protein JXB10_12940 [Pirellulales bacterium]|nr:hypothetical protein [Pirellulales bacterium]
MKKMFLFLLIGALATAPWTPAVLADSASGTNPLVVVSLAGYDALKADLASVGKMVDVPELGASLEGMLKLFTKGEGLAGLDKSRPWGAAFFDDGHKKSGFVFLPVTELQKFYEVLKPFTGEPEALGDGMYKVQKDGKTTFVKQGAGWAFFASRAEDLANLPADPAKLLGDLPRQYAVALRLMASNATEKQREDLCTKLKAEAERDMRRRPFESDDEYAIRKQVAGEVLKVLTRLIDGMEEVTLGLALDAEGQKTYFDVSATGKEGSPIDQAAAALKDGPSRFSGFLLPEATLTGNWVGKLPPFKAELLEQILQTVKLQKIAEIEKKERNPERAEAAKKLLVQVIDLLERSVKSGRADGGLAVVLKPQSATILAGGCVANDGRIEEMLKTVYAAAKAEKPVVADWVKFDADQCRGVQLHTLSLPIPPEAKDREKMVSLIGETLEIVIGTDKESVYVAAGREPINTLKQVIEASASASTSSAPPIRFSLDLCRLAEFVAVEGKAHERPVARRMAEELKKSPEADHLLLTVQAIDRGVRYRLELEPGVQRLICRWALDRMLKGGHP